MGRDVGEDEYRGGTGSAIEVVKRSGSAVRTRRRSDGGLRLLTNGSRVGREESFKGAEVKDGQQEVWEEKDRGKGSGWMGSVDVSLPNTNGETQTNLLVSREVFFSPFFFIFIFSYIFPKNPKHYSKRWEILK